MTLEELGNNYISQANRVKNEITGLRPLLLIYRDDRLNDLKNRILVLYRLGRYYNYLGQKLLLMAG